MKIGFITHLSIEYPLIVNDIFKGLKSSLGEEATVTKSFVSSSISNNKFIDEAQKLLIDGVDVLVVYSSYFKLVELEEFIDKYKVKGVFIHEGFYLNSSEKKITSKNVVQVTLQLAECFHTLGVYLNKDLKGKVGVISDFINSGFHAGYYLTGSLLNSPEDMGFQYAIGLDQREEEYQEVIKQYLTSVKPSVVFLNTSKQIGEKVLSFCAKNESIRPFLSSIEWIVGDEFLQNAMFHPKEFGVKLLSCTTFDPNVLAEMKNKISGVEESDVPLISSLGYEAGTIAKQIFSNEIKGFEGPRGKLEWLKEISTFKLISNIVAINNNTISLVESREVEALPALENYGGWENAYLCY